jgi:RNA polymerase sigma-54 factor
MRYEQQARQVTRQKMGAKLIAAGRILEMSSLELGDRVDEELATNPALELTDDALCPVCHGSTRGGSCLNCGLDRAQRSDADALARYLAEPPLPRTRAEARDDDLEDPYLRAEMPVTLQAHLQMQGRAALPDDDHRACDYLIANINDHGLLDCDPQEAAREVGLPVERIERILGVIQAFEPAGVGARTSQQALLIQLRQLQDDGADGGCAELVIRHHWNDLANQAHGKIARALRVPRSEVEQAVDFIRTNLDPYPGRQFRSFWQNLPQNPQAISRPDVIIRRNVEQYVVEVVESCDFVLRISESYRELQRMLVRQKRIHRVPPEWRHTVDALKRADWFIQSLRMRRRTLQTVTEAIVEVQQPFFDTGLEENLRPLTRARLARTVGKHESTVSRALANKFVLLPPPANTIVGYDRFFTPALSVKSVIGQLVQRESPYRPLTDRQICQILHSRGFKVARRTVAKYRLALQIPSSEQRGRR